MTSTDHTISGTVLYETDDDLSETNVGSAYAQPNASDYVVRGCGFSVDHNAETITIGNTNTRGNYAIVTTSTHIAYHLQPNQSSALGLETASGTNHVFIAYDTSADSIYYHIDTEDSGPSDPSVKIGTVDTSNDTSTEVNRTAPAEYDTTEVSSDYTTSGEDVILANTSGDAVTVTLADTDRTKDGPIQVYNLDGSNAVTVDTEGGGVTIDPDADSQKVINNAGDSAAFIPDGSNWDSSLDAEFDAVTTDQISISESVTRLTATSDQTISTGGSSKTVEFDTVGVDKLNAADLANNRITIQETGYYFITGFYNWESDGTWSTGDSCGPAIGLNGSVRSGQNVAGLKIGTGQQQLNARPFAGEIASGNHITLTGYQDSGSDKVLGASAADRQRNLIVMKIG